MKRTPFVILISLVVAIVVVTFYRYLPQWITKFRSGTQQSAAL